MTPFARRNSVERSDRNPPDGDVVPIPLRNEEATRDGVLKALNKLQKADSNDLIVVFFAGHGVKDKTSFYLLTHEAEVGDLAATALSGAELSKQLRGLPCTVLLMLDACHSAGFGQGKVLAQKELRPATDDALTWLILATGVPDHLPRWQQAITSALRRLFVRNQLARWAGVAIAFVNAIIQTLLIPAFPWWSLSLFAIDMLVIYGLIVHGGKDE